ncbi:MAG: redoxin domain-containing protein [Planctomycetes bacterium]|nr:redoxin domain-containing protein [Planctomycetota bacterium]
MTDGQTRGKSKFLIALVGIAILVAGIGCNGSSKPTPTAPEKKVATGRGPLIYQATCAACHGSEGAGDGVTAATLRPPPRDFAARPWRFDVTKESIRRVIVEGIPGTTMPAVGKAISPADLDSLVDHVYYLSTSRPTIEYVPSPDELLLREAGFTDMRGLEAPPLNLTDAKGNTVKLSDLKGKLVIINFWATTCTHCLAEMPNWRKFQDSIAGKPIEILHICTDADTPKAAQEVLDEGKSGNRALVDGNEVNMARYDVQILPTIWVIDPAGKVVGKTLAAKEWQSPLMKRFVENWTVRKP